MPKKPRKIPEFTIEGSWFAGRVLEMGIIAYGDHTYEEWKELAPDRVYAFDTCSRMERLRRHIFSLNDLPKLLTFNGLPMPSREGNVGRGDWIEVCLDVALTRLTSVRDITLLLVAEIFELGLDPREVTVKKLKARGVPEDVLRPVNKLVNVALDLRGERNRRIHHGERRRHTADHTILYWASVAEANGFPPANIDALPSMEKEGKTYSLSTRYREFSDELLDEFVGVAAKLVKVACQVIDSLEDHFEPRFKEKLARSKLGL